jgi:hypothetical protein
MALTAARVLAAIDAAVSTTTHAQLHTGDPGAAGTSNVAAGISRAALSFPAASAGQTSDDASFAIPGAGGPFTHVSLWTASTGGTYCGSGALTPAESFAGAGTLDVTVTVTGFSS